MEHQAAAECAVYRGLALRRGKLVYIVAAAITHATPRRDIRSNCSFLLDEQVGQQLGAPAAKLPHC